MWRITILTAILYVLSIEGRPMESHQSAYWTATDLMSPQRLFRRSNSDILKELEQRDSYNTESTDDRQERQEEQQQEDDDELNMVLRLPHHDKRALAMMARWGPFSSIGKERTPIRSNYVDPATIDAHSRGRMAGQPLRWG